MRDPIKENINEKTGKVTYEFSINLGVPPGEDKPFRTRRRGFPNKKAAWAAYMLLKARAAEGIFPEREKSKLSNIEKSVNEPMEFNDTSTVAEYFTVFWASYIARGNESTTHDKTYNCFKNHILPQFGRTALKDISPIKCKQFATELINNLVSARQILIYFKSFLEDAKYMKLIKDNPMDNVYIPSKGDVKRKKQIPGEEDVFFSNYYELEDLMKFLSASKEYCPEKHHIFWLLLAHSGLRRGEAIALKWSDIDFETRLIRVNKAAAYSTEKKLHIKTTKNRINRKVRLNRDTLNELMQWKQSQECELRMKNQYQKNDDEQYIFQNKFNELSNPSSCGRWLNALYNRCDIKRITVHGLRHTHCTLGLKSRQYSIEEMMQRLGHKDIKMTMDVYTHVTHETMETNPDLYMEYLRSEMKKINKVA